MKSEENFLEIHAVAVSRNFVFAVTVLTNHLIKFSITENKIEKIYSIPNRRYSAGMYSKPTVFDDEIVFIPYHAKDIVKFDIEKEQFSVISCDFTTSEIEALGKFTEVIKNGECVYGIGEKLDLVMKYDHNTNKVEKVKYDIERIQKLKKNKNADSFYFNSAIIGGKCYIPMYSSMNFCMLDFETNAISEIQPIDVDDDGCVAIASIDEEIYISTMAGKFLKWDCNKNEVAIIDIKSSAYCQMVSGDNELFLFRAFEPCIEIRSVKNLNVSEVIRIEEEATSNDTCYWFSFATRINDVIIFQERTSGAIYWLKCDDGKRVLGRLQLNDAVVEFLRKRVVLNRRKDMACETEVYNLEWMIDSLEDYRGEDNDYC